MPLLAASSYLNHLVFQIVLGSVGLFLILLVLVQRGRGGGLSGALGGMGGQSAFGAKAGDLFTRITVVTAACWIILSMASVKILGKAVEIKGGGGSGAFVPPAVPGEGGGTTGEGASGLTSPGDGTTAPMPETPDDPAKTAAELTPPDAPGPDGTKPATDPAETPKPEEPATEPTAETPAEPASPDPKPEEPATTDPAPSAEETPAEPAADKPAAETPAEENPAETPADLPANP